jgi:putative ABC transport system permease protein
MRDRIKVMRTSTLLHRNLTFYWRTHLAVIFGVAIAVAVLAGALLVGDSVRASLRDLFLLRLGQTDQVIAATGFFREKLADELQAHPQFLDAFNGVCPLIVFEGVVTHAESGRRGSGVTVYGVDDRFWDFHGRTGQAPSNREVLLSESLAQELGSKPDDAILLMVKKPSAIPLESLHGRQDDAGRTLRLRTRAVLPATELGEFSLRAHQGAVRAAFVSLRRLQEDLGQPEKVNTILLDEKEPGAGNQAAGGAALADKLLRETFTLADLGIKLRVVEGRGRLALETDSALLSDALAEKARAAADGSGWRAESVLTYLANTIRSSQREIPYSLVTGLDPLSFEALKRGEAQPPQPGRAANAPAAVASPSASAIEPRPPSTPAPPPPSAAPVPPILLNDWAARDLQAKPGELLTLEYYVWQDEGRLLTQSARFHLIGIVPLTGAAADRDLAPEYPGITESDSLADWDPPFPMELSRIRPIDEQYWDEHRTTPKAFIPLETGQSLWPSRFGKLTSLRFVPGPGQDLAAAAESYRSQLKATLDPIQLGFSVQDARAQGLQASRGATDFGQYFVYFSFFLVVSALLLTSLFFKLGIEQRLREIGLLRAVGFPPAQIRALFLSEGARLATLGSLAGLGGAVAYGWIMLFGLRTWWVGAVGTTMLMLHVSPVSLLIGGAGGVLTALGCIAWTLRALAPASPRSLLAGALEAERPEYSAAAHERRGERETRGKIAASPPLPVSPSPRLRVSMFRRLFSARTLAILFGGTGLLLLLGAFFNLVGQVAGFFIAGTLLLIALLCWLSWWLRRDQRKLLAGHGWWPVSQLGFRNARHRPGRSLLCIALIASATFIIVAVDAFRRDDQSAALDRQSGSGGFPLLAESLLPLTYDLNTVEGREALTLPPLLEEDAGRESAAGSPSAVSFARFRVRPGDDASCLNLYQPRNPRILAPTAGFIKEGRFAFQSALANAPEERANPWLLLEREADDGAIPVIGDANSMTYVLHLNLGEELVINQSTDRPIRLRLVATLSDSIFQGELLMAEKHFVRLFPEQEGYRFFLLDAPAGQTAEVTRRLEEALSDFGFDVMPTNERLASFHRVENTYLSTFQTLGGLGVGLGTLGLATVLLRNVIERRRELALLRAVGYNSSHFALMVVAENLMLLFGGLVTGTFCAVLAIAPAFFARGGGLPTASLGVLLLAVLATGLAASLLALVAVIRAPLLPALRAE